MTADTLTVKDFIIPVDRYPHVHEAETIHDAVQVIQSYTCGENDRLRYSELLVLNDKNQLAGRLTLQDILKGLDKRLVEVSKVKEFEGKGAEYPNLAILWEESFFIECSNKADRLIRDFMSPTTTIKAGDPLVKALSVILNGNDVIMPVVEEERVIGVIRLEEIFKAICAQCKL